MTLAVLCVAGQLIGCATQSHRNGDAVWRPDTGDGTYENPIIFADYSDPDAVRVGDDFYLTASSFSSVPGLPILHSTDLVNWTIIGHAFEKYPFDQFDIPQPGKGVWAPSIRYHEGAFYIFFGDPDNGIFMTKTTNPAGPWEPLVRVKNSKGWIDTCPFWDDDGKAYLIHAWAKSRSGTNNLLTINQMSPDGTKLLDDGQTVVNGYDGGHRTLEGPKLYKRNGYYYIFAPAGGVTEGYQLVYRSRNIYGPYEGRRVMDQGRTQINGPHQGAWVELESGESWFIHFQDRGGYGRVTHLQPMHWVDDWPVIGNDPDDDGKGEPVLRYKKPDVGKVVPIAVPQTTDDFNSPKIGLQWQWAANFKDEWYSLSARPGWLRLFAVPKPASAKNIRGLPNVLLQKMPAPEFTVTTKVNVGQLAAGEKAGLVVLGGNYSFIGIEKTRAGTRLIKVSGGEHENDAEEGTVSWSNELVILRVKVAYGPSCEFSYSADGRNFATLGRLLTARAAGWSGARVGLFCSAPENAENTGHFDVDWFRVQK